MNWLPRDPNNIRVSVVIPLFNQVEMTRACLTALSAAGWHPDDELILVDNASTDATDQLLEEVAGRCTVIRNSINRNFGGACNQGVSAARGQWICFLNNDTEVLGGWIEALVDEAESSSADIIGARLLYPDGTIQHAGVAFEPHIYPRHLYHGRPGNTPGVSRSYDCQVVTGACMLVSRAVLHDIGAFDELFINGYEDVDFCLRARAAGYHIRYCADAIATHHESPSPGRHDHEDANRETFFDRWRSKLNADLTFGEEIIEVASPSRPWVPEAHITTSIIIPVYGNVELTRACVDSILGNGLPDHAEIILVDNASPSATQTYLRSLLNEPQIRVVILDENQNFSGGCNVGHMWARGDRAIFLNNDTVVHPGWLEPLEAALDEPATGIVGARLLYPDGSVQHAGVSFSAHGEAFHVLVGVDGNDQRVTTRREVQAVTGACLGIRTALFEFLEGFDERYINGCEDIDLCLHARLHGFRVVYEPASVVTHHESKSKDRLKHLVRNFGHFFSQWAGMTFADAPTFEYPLPTYATDTTPTYLDLRNRDCTLAEAMNRELAFGSGEYLGIMLTGAQRSLSYLGTDRIVLYGDGACVGCIAVARKTAERIGGFDTGLSSESEQLVDWLNRARLSGILVEDLTLGVLPAPSPWYTPLSGERSSRAFAHRWRAGHPVQVPTPAPLLTNKQRVSDHHFDVRSNSILLAPGYNDTATLSTGMRALLTAIRADDDVSIVVRILEGDDACITELDRIADSAVDELPDVIVVVTSRQDDLAIAQKSSAIIVGGPDARIQQSLSRTTGNMSIALNEISRGDLDLLRASSQAA